MRKSIFYFLLYLPAFIANGQPTPEKKILTVEGFAEQAIRADEIYYSLTSLNKTARMLEDLDDHLPVASPRLLPASGQARRDEPALRTDACVRADSMLHNWLLLYGSNIELVEQELFDEIGVSAASDRYLLKIKSVEAFKSLLARLETCPCFIGELVQVGYSQPEALRHELTLVALRDARRNAGEMLALFGRKIRTVYNIAPAKVTWVDASLSSGENWSPFDPKLNRTLELVCRVQVTVQFRFK